MPNNATTKVIMVRKTNVEIKRLYNVFNNKSLDKYLENLKIKHK